jgi:Mg-chelatase subunit ChlD
MPALAGSLLTHLALLLVLAMIGRAASPDRGAPEFRTEVVSTQLSDFATLEQTEQAELEQTTITPVGGSFAPVTTAILAERYALDGSAAVPQPAGPAEVKAAPELRASTVQVGGFSLPKPTRLDAAVSIRGNGAEHVENVEGAVDRVAVEILRKLEAGPTLVVWMFDASGSLHAERQRLAEYIEQVYEHIDQLDQSQLAQNEGLLTAVVAFGHDRQPMLDAPTADREAIARAIRNIPLDRTGIETPFRTVGEIARKYGRYSKKGRGYKAMTVMITDEVGDDEELLEAAIGAAVAVKMPVYVLGSSALFGREEGYVDFTDPETGVSYSALPVRQGPESAAIEGIRLPFWYDGPQYELLDAGFGPYALSRLAGATGGIYFITRLGGHRVHFEPTALREYRPDWVSREQYLAMLQKYPLRRAVMRAGTITQQNLPGMPELTFPPVESPDFKEAMTRNQEVVARIQYTVDEALGLSGAAPGEATVASVVELRDREPSRRWQAQYDLIRGRLLAMRIRCLEFNLACARMKKEPLAFTKPNSNAWRLVPDREIHLPERYQAEAQEAVRLLERVITDHPGTPWALLAQRELKDPLGLKWVEVFVPPPRRGGDGGDNPPPRPRREPPRPKPPPPPRI